MRSILRWCLLAASGLVLAGCVGFQSKPIVSRQVLQELQRIRLDALRPADPPKSEERPSLPAFDASNGLSADEAVAVALFLNPDLRTVRKERGVAEGELVTAKLLPNPELQVAWLFIENFTKSLATSGWDVALNWAPPRPGETAAKVERAKARIEVVRAQIAEAEWRLAVDVRKAHATLWANQEQLRLADASLALQERFRTLLREKGALGDASRLEINLLELEYIDRRREREVIANSHGRARQELNRLLGLPPLAEVALEDPRLFLAYYQPLRLKPEVLEAVMVDGRPDLVVAKQEYEQAQQDLRLAYIQRIPWFRFGPGYERDGSRGEGIVNKFGIGLSIDLPLANLNQGEIARLEAAREKLRETFIGRMHGARAEVHEAHLVLAGSERVVVLLRDIGQPALDENEQLTQASVTLGDVNVFQFVTAQDKALRNRREFIGAQLEYWKARFDLERALGAPIREVDGREE